MSGEMTHPAVSNVVHSFICGGAPRGGFSCPSGNSPSEVALPCMQHFAALNYKITFQRRIGMKEKLQGILQTAKEQLAAAKDSRALDEARVKFLGKRVS